MVTFLPFQMVRTLQDALKKSTEENRILREANSVLQLRVELARNHGASVQAPSAENSRENTNHKASWCGGEQTACPAALLLPAITSLEGAMQDLGTVLHSLKEALDHG